MLEKTCSKCQKNLTCYAGDESQACWCKQLPLIPLQKKLNAQQDCYCEACLIPVLNQQINALTEQCSINEIVSFAMPYRNQKNLTELIDYTVEEGNYVFTKWFHLKRGSCCGNGCRNCPYSSE